MELGVRVGFNGGCMAARMAAWVGERVGTAWLVFFAQSAWYLLVAAPPQLAAWQVCSVAS